MKRLLTLLLLGSLAGVTAPAARADETAEQAAERFSERLEQEIARTRRDIELARARRSGGAIVTPTSVVFVDGAEIPLEWTQWVEPVQIRRIRRAARTDTLLRVGPGVTLSLANLAGDIRVVTWDRNEVRIEAEHDRSDKLVTEMRNAVIKLGVGSKQRSPAEVEWKLTVPAWLPLELSGIESEIEVTGLRSSLRAQSMRGDVIVVGCHGPLEANSIEGEVHVTDVSGNVSVGSVNSVVRLVRVVGPVEAQTINGDIQLEKVESMDVDASTVNGRVYFASGYRPRGRYAFSSHNGRLIVPVPTDQNVNVTLASFQGQVESSMPVPNPAPRAKGRAMRFMFRDGVATPEVPELTAMPGTPLLPRVPRAPRAPRPPQMAPTPAVPELELESFGGLIRLASQEEVLKALTMQRAMLDSLRSLRSSARRSYEEARRLARRYQAPEAPAPPPTPEPPRED